ncbi:Hypothetical predicted protein [Marmota monax]|uniref:Uncharacterized protein n=1 Tax=Marmota monax TaxID=9995 RepID=A0A5E4CWP4_MARMO|nr:Hypothetical predicted protein [Marmota monax]
MSSFAAHHVCLMVNAIGFRMDVARRAHLWASTGTPLSVFGALGSVKGLESWSVLQQKLLSHGVGVQILKEKGVLCFQLNQSHKVFVYLAGGLAPVEGCTPPFLEKFKN